MIAIDIWDVQDNPPEVCGEIIQGDDGKITIDPPEFADMCKAHDNCMTYYAYWTNGYFSTRLRPGSAEPPPFINAQGQEWRPWRDIPADDRVSIAAAALEQ